MQLPSGLRKPPIMSLDEVQDWAFLLTKCVFTKCIWISWVCFPLWLKNLALANQRRPQSITESLSLKGVCGVCEPALHFLSPCPLGNPPWDCLHQTGSGAAVMWLSRLEMQIFVCAWLPSTYYLPLMWLCAWCNHLRLIFMCPQFIFLLWQKFILDRVSGGGDECEIVKTSSGPRTVWPG